METVILDDKERVLLRMNQKGQFLFGRYEDMSQADTDFLISLCGDLIKDVSKDELAKFLKFEGDGELCS